MVQVVHTDLHQPSLSLLTKLCYPAQNQLRTEPILYGRMHEEDARQAYKCKMVVKHNNFCIHTWLLYRQGYANPWCITRCCC